MKEKIRGLTASPYSVFKRSELYRSLKGIPLARKAKLFSGKLVWRFFPHNPNLHDDPFLQKAFLFLVTELKPTSIVETGTFLGASTGFIARNFSDIKIFTCEINKQNYKNAKKNLSKYKNVKQFLNNSPEFLNKIIKKDVLRERPLFFLDAHWLDQWPLENELKIISKELDKAIIFIDDFKVPGEPQFNYDKYGNKECSMEIVNPNLSSKNSYNLLLPSYKVSDIFINSKKDLYLVGVAMLFQNMDKEFKKIIEHPFISRYFQDRSKLIKI